jgi:membrane-associated protease RseP (regulator of RpoE activity)
MMDSIIGILHFLWILFLVIMVFNFMIIVHEWGHFLAARWRGLQIDKFQIWFGKPIWKKKWNGVQYGVGCIPAGGFVALPQMAPMEMIEGSGDSPRDKLPAISPMDKIIVAFAGPLFSFLLACFFAVIVWQIGYPVDESTKTKTIGYISQNVYGLELLDPANADAALPKAGFGSVAIKKSGEELEFRLFDGTGKKIDGNSKDLKDPDGQLAKLKAELEGLWKQKFVPTPKQNEIAATVAALLDHSIKPTPAEASDLEVGDEVIAIEGQEVKRFHGMVDSVKWAIVSSENDVIDMEVKGEDGHVRKVSVEAPLAEVDDEWNKLSWWQKLWNRPPLRTIGVAGKETPLVASVLKNGPAAEAGIMPDDFIETLNGESVLHRMHVTQFVEANPGQELTVGVRRGKEHLEFKLTPREPDEGEQRLMLGLNWSNAGDRQLDTPSPVSQVIDSMRMMKNTLAAVFSSKSKIGASHLSGPIGIGSLYYNLFKHPDGWRLVIWFSVILNINLAILNMLPFPVLDGGHITMALLEWIRRRPLDTRFLEVVQGTAVILLFGFMIFVTMKDAGNLFGGRGEAEGAENPKFHPR